MNEQRPQQPVQVNLNGGVYPNEDGTWRVVCWFSGISGEEEAKKVSVWLNGLLQANLIQPPPDPDRADTRPPRPDPSVPFAKS